MNLPLMALLLVILLAVWLFIRLRRTDDPDPPKPRLRASATSSDYHAVSIEFSGNACEAAEAMAGRRFLSTAAPKLPLPDCHALECECRFVHYQDRRAHKDRRSPFGPSGFGGGTGSLEQEQRAGKDRRNSGDEDFF
jgi:hypothetical protein